MELLFISQEDWFQKLAHAQQELLQQSLFLIKDMGEHERRFFDYSFIIMPAAKAYEGFVKDVLFNLHLISQKKYEGTRFRVGKSLNPELEKIPKLKREALYDDLAKLFGDEKVPKLMWETWRVCRNRTFHYFPKKQKTLSLSDARGRVEQIIKTVSFVLTHPEYRNQTRDRNIKR